MSAAKGTSSKAGGKRDERLFRVRSAANFTTGWFDQYSTAIEFAAMMIARAACANAMKPSHEVRIEWTNDAGATIQEIITVNVTRSGASG